MLRQNDYEFKALSPNLKKNKNTRTGVIAQWQSAYLVCVGPWIDSQPQR
jgi:hypothetical protein